MINLIRRFRSAPHLGRSDARATLSKAESFARVLQICMAICRRRAGRGRLRVWAGEQSGHTIALGRLAAERDPVVVGGSEGEQ